MTGWNNEHWSKVLPYLDEALALEPAEREGWLVALGRTESRLEDDLRELLALHADNCASGFLERSPFRGDELLVGQQIGSYTVERLLGRGGMGTVWRARRSDGKFEGRVAIKVLDRRGLGPGAADQIRHEASLLARLSDPHIARLFDAGVRQNGQPYLILEYIEGEAIDRYCAAGSLTLSQRLQLFLPVLDAVAHAHAQLIVHRDLKPSNVMVTRDGMVKLLDFGIASLELQAQQPGADPGPAPPHALTPGYAAPEQLRGEPVSAASDVYALGALLYVLVAGSHPHGAAGSTHTELARATLTQDPRPASKRLATASERRRVSGDLDAIVARALNRVPAQRYATAAEFAADIRHLLGNFPVTARTQTRRYVAQKFAQRHWGGVFAAVLVFVVLIGAGAVTTLQMFEARRQRDFARAQLARAEALNELNNYVLIDAAPSGKPFTVNELLARAAHLLQRQTADDGSRIALLTWIGHEYDLQDQGDQAVGLLQKAYALSRGVSDRSVRANAACDLADALRHGDSSQSEALIAEGLRELPGREEFAFDRANCLLRGADVATGAGNAPLAIERTQSAIDVLHQVPFAQEMTQLRAKANLAESYRTAGRYRDAIAVFEVAWPRLVALGRDDTITAVAWLNNWAMDLEESGRPLEAERLLRRALELQRVGTSDDAVSPMVLTNYSQELYELARFDEAAGYAERAYRWALKAGDPVVVNQTLLRLARIYRARHELGAARQALDEVGPRLQKALPPGHRAFATLNSERSLLAQSEGDPAGALRLANQAMEIVEQAAQQGRAGGLLVPLLLMRRASVETDMHQLPRAEEDTTESLRLLQASQRPGDFSMFTGDAYLTLARVLQAEGRSAAARDAARRAAAQLEKAVGADHPDTHSAEVLGGGSLARP